MQLTFAQKENIGVRYVLDALRPCSAYGQELLRDLQPMGPAQRREIQRQLENIGRILAHPECRRQLQQLQRLFMGLKMIRPTACKCREADLNAIELFEIKRFLLQTQEMLPLAADLLPVLQLEGIALTDTAPALAIVDPEGQGVASFYIPDSLSPALADIRLEKRALEQQLREHPDPSLQARRSQLAAAEEAEELRIQGQMSQALRPFLGALLANMDAIADWDLTMEKARIAALYGGCMPELTQEELDLEQMQNPRIADLLQSQNKAFTPISITLAPGAAVITGANMGGKSVALKTIALNIYLVHCGFFPFARRCRMPLFDGLHMISEDLESIDRGLSSFGGEMVRFNAMVQEIRQGFHFVLLDEFARGTNPQEGAALVRAVTRYLCRQSSICVLATHYDHVAEVADAHYQVAGLKDLDWAQLARQIQGFSPQEGADQITRYMNYGLYRVRDRQDCPRDALRICRLLGMDEKILEDAEKTVSLPAEID